MKKCLNRREIVTCLAFREFIELDIHSDEFKIELLYMIDNLNLEINDFIYLKDKQIIIISCSDKNILSKIKSGINEIKMNFTDITKFDNNRVYIFKTSNDNYINQKLWSYASNNVICIIYWDIYSEMLFIGLSNGNICFFKEKDDIMNLSMVSEFNLNKDNIIGLSYNHKNEIIFICYKYKFLVFNIKFNEKVNGIFDLYYRNYKQLLIY